MLRAALLIAALLTVAPSARAQDLRRTAKPFSSPRSGTVTVRARTKAPAPRTSAAPQIGSSCTLVTFEGLGDSGPIPTFQGISLPSWLSIIEKDFGGTGNFANEPSPVTTAFWLNGNPTTQTIQIPNGAAWVSFYYSSSVDVTVTAYDSKGNALNTASGPSNYDFDDDLFDNWGWLQVLSNGGNTIASITVQGLANQTGIDNLNVCQVASIDSVEITQAIQEYQTLSDFQASLASNGEPPVPIIAGKPAVLRLYFQALQNVTPVVLQMSGVSSQSKGTALMPSCADADQRAGNNGCVSVDFYFTPPTGTWQATLDNLDGSGNVLQELMFSINSRRTGSLELKGVTVCDAPTLGPTGCASATNLLGLNSVLTKIAPSSTTFFGVTNNSIMLDTSTYTYIGPGPKGQPFWWSDVVRQINSLYSLFDSAVDQFTGQYTTYYGMIRPLPALSAQLAGLAFGIPSNGAASITTANGLAPGSNISSQVVAHETGHTLGLKHTNTALPAASGVSGCFGLAPERSTDWPYANNFLQSGPAATPQIEVGFDVVGRMPLNPNTTFEIMGYCVPGWISPQRYETLIATLGGGTINTDSVTGPTAEKPTVRTQPRTTANGAGPFWLVSGTIQSGVVTFDPLFQLVVQGDTTTETGTYSLTVQGSAAQPLFVRQFDPPEQPMEVPGSTVSGPLAFSETLPVVANASAIVLIDPSGNQLGSIALGGNTPTVAITSPAAGFIGTGTKVIAWTVADPGKTNFWAMVLYSSNNGATWSQVGNTVSANSLAVDFDSLPGSAQAQIEVIVSDGVNSGAATSPTFTVVRKLPSLVSIDTPQANSAQPAVDPVYLSGTAYDPDDGVLTGSALQWSSNLQGPLGSGSPLSVHLQPGIHTIQLLATDSDGNSISTTANVTIGGPPPQVGLQTVPVNTAPTTCETATITAKTGQNGAPLSLVQYSLDGGGTYNTVSLSALPYQFTVPGTGFFHVVARAYDTSGQSNAADATFFTRSACPSVVLKCQIKQAGSTTVADVQLMINEAMGTAQAKNDVNGDGAVNIVDVQLVMNAALGLGCTP